MAKALFGHVQSSADTRLLAEVHRLRARVCELEVELDRARAATEALAGALHVEDDLRTLTLDEPALT